MNGYRLRLEASHLASSTINLRLEALRRLAFAVGDVARWRASNCMGAVHRHTGTGNPVERMEQPYGCKAPHNVRGMPDGFRAGFCPPEEVLLLPMRPPCRNADVA
jgi:hypothetical protein